MPDRQATDPKATVPARQAVVQRGLLVASFVAVAVGAAQVLGGSTLAQAWQSWQSWQAGPPVVFSAARDPWAFDLDLAVLTPAPVVDLTRDLTRELTREDAVAYELIRRSNSLSERQARRTAQALCAEARAQGFDPLLFVALIHVESQYNHLAVSPVGAEGLMQLMPATAAWMADRDAALQWRIGDSFDPVTNVRLGVRYFVELHREFRRLDAALTAYNRGPTATRRLLEEFGQLPDDVRDLYARKVLGRYGRLISHYGQLPSDA